MDNLKKTKFLLCNHKISRESEVGEFHASPPSLETQVPVGARSVKLAVICHLPKSRTVNKHSLVTTSVRHIINIHQ